MALYIDSQSTTNKSTNMVAWLRKVIAVTKREIAPISCTVSTAKLTREGLDGFNSFPINLHLFKGLTNIKY
jgi:hypothetical protein